MTSPQSIEVEADSSLEARKQIQSRIPENFEILSEKYFQMERLKVKGRLQIQPRQHMRKH
jgi:hypothetical protein